MDLDDYIKISHGKIIEGSLLLLAVIELEK